MQFGANVNRYSDLFLDGIVLQIEISISVVGYTVPQLLRELQSRKGRRCIPTPIGTKSLTITEEAYDQLREHKRDDESFTHTILRLTGSDRDVMRGFGMMSDVDGFREAVEQTREDLDADLRERSSR